MSSNPPEAPPFLSGGGEMGEALRRYPWHTTPMGAPETWPQSLRTALSIMLRAHYPINVYWGASLTNFYNDAYLPIIGRKHPEALGRPLAEVWPEVWPSIEPMLQAVREKGESFHAENVQQFVTRSGFSEEIFMSFSYTPVYTEAGAIGGVFAAGTEVTGAVVGQRRLRLLRDLGGCAAGVGRTEAACGAMADVLARYREDVPFSLFYLREPGPGGASVWRRAAASGFREAPVPPDALPASLALPHETGLREIEAGELGLEFPPGPWEEAPRNAVVAPLRTEPGAEPLGVLVAGVSARRSLDEGYRTFFGLLAEQAERGLSGARAIAVARERQRELERLDRAKTEFLATVSHEFRTPLTLILGPLEDLESREDLSEAGTGAVVAARRNAHRLLRLVTNLLEYSRLLVGSTSARFAPTDLVRLTEWAASLFQSAIEHAGLAYRVEVEPLTQPVYVDRRLWEHVLFNLLSNALKFTREGAVTVRLREDASNPARPVVLEVEDTGAGIPESVRDRIFERFTHASAPGARSEEGVGIGLSLVRELATLHGGTVSFESEVGRGTRFSVRLPYGRQHLDPDQVVDEPEIEGPPSLAAAYAAEAEQWMPPAAEGLAAATAELATGRHQVLVVDDNAGMRDYLREELGKDFDVRVAADVRQAEALLDEGLPDCIVADVMLPEQSGIDWVARLREAPETALVPILLLSARADERSRLDGLSAGADDYLAKPFSAEELRARIRRQVQGLVERARRERDLRLEAEAAERAKSAFLANMSHEIRTPLTPILLSAAATARRTEDPQSLKALRRIEASARRLGKMLDGLLSLSRLEAAKDRSREAVGVAEVVFEVVESLRGESAAGVELRVETSEAGSTARALAEPGALASIVQNLVSNALKFTEEGEVLVRVDTGASDAAPADGGCGDRAPQAVHLHVRDTGIGIAPEFMPALFDMFSQESEGWDRTHEGTGIGLALTKRLVDAVGGTVQVASAKGEGSHFLVSLPLADGAGPHARQAPAPAPEAPSGRLRVLLVEDQTDTREITAEMLGERFEVTAEAHGRGALEAAGRTGFDVALLDIHLGGGESGVEVLQGLRRLAHQAGMQAVALTAFALPGDREKLLDAGFAAYLSKPYEPERLFELIERLGTEARERRRG